MASMQQPEIKWQEPPASRRGQRNPRWKPVADALRARPGEWALIAEDDSRGRLSSLRKGFFKLAEFEITTRSRENSVKVDYYARYIGGAK